MPDINPRTDQFQSINGSEELRRFSENKATPRREYFSGANVKVYFGDVWVDQIQGISFTLQEQVAPIYGFSSYTFDRISRGSRMVQGQFTIHFTENGYMQSILNRISESFSTYGTKAPAPPQDQYIGDINQLQTIKDLLSIKDKQSYKNQMESLKASFWGNNAPSDNSSIVSIKDNDSYYYTPGRDNNTILKDNGFNILIDYSPDSNEKDFQDCLNNISTGQSSYQTYRSIIGVHIGSEAQSIVNNGQVIAQTYQFIAQDLDGDITKMSIGNR